MRGIFTELTRPLPVPSILITSSGEIKETNVAASQLLGDRQGFVSGTNITDYIFGESRTAMAYLRVCSRSSEPLPGSMTFIDHEGNEADCRCAGFHVSGAGLGYSESLIHLTCTRRDSRSSAFMALNRKLEELNKAYHSLKLTRNTFQTVLDSQDAIVYVADMDTYELLFINEKVRTAFGDILGKKCWEGLQVDQSGPCPFCTNKHLLDANGQPTGVYEWQFENTSNGRWYELRDSAIQWTDGRIVRCEIGIDITELKTSEAAIKHSDALLREAQRIAELGSWELDRASGTLRWSDELFRILGLDPEKSDPSYESFINRVHPDDRKLVDKAWMESLKNYTPYDMTHRLRMPDGAIKHVHARHHASIGPGQPATRSVGTIQDITCSIVTEDKLRRSLTEKEILLKEIHHRVKNNMAIISSMLALQSRYTDDSRVIELLMQSQNRIRTMALVHEKLYQSDDFTNIHTPGYIEALVNQISSFYRHMDQKIETPTDIEDISLELSVLLPCGLIINELITNAFKHAFVDAGEGQIFIKMYRIADDMIQLEIHDNGKGLPEGLDVDNPGSLGLTIVNSLISQLNGTLEITRRHGTKYSLRFPGKAIISKQGIANGKNNYN